MICRHCQSEIADQSNYCNRCGARQLPVGGHRQLMRSRTDARLGGVCGGLGEYFDVDPTLVRVLWMVLSVVPGCLVGGIIAYVALWIIIPRAPEALTGTAFQAQAKVG
jgi:phage shock protein C